MTAEIERLARLLKVLGDTNRLNIFISIGKNSRSVTEIINITELSQTLVSFHLRALRGANIVRSKREGPFIYYSLSNPSLMDLVDDLSRTINRKDSDNKNIPETTSDTGLAKLRR
jgi:DNA-binding transcriptional ArsR family regulator